FAHVKDGIVHNHEFQLPDWDVDEFLRILNQAPDRAAGLDSWAPRHWRRMTRRAATWLLCFFNLLEDGCAWPEQLLHAKAVFISKPTTAWEDPLSFRILMILSYCYRVWAKLCLLHVATWVQSWATEDMYAVRRGQGADAAWYRSAVLREEALMVGKPFSGACDDV
ncbi:MAG: hypothetical protein ACKPKO_41310, partial [Candidatus Fonsibacter sp.]